MFKKLKEIMFNYIFKTRMIGNKKSQQRNEDFKKYECKRHSSIENVNNEIQDSVDGLNSIFEMAEKRTGPEDRNYPIQRTEGRSEMEELSPGELWDNGKISLSRAVMGVIEGEKERDRIYLKKQQSKTSPNLMKTCILQIQKLNKLQIE